MTKFFIERLEKRLQGILPGREAQELMAPAVRFPADKFPDPKLSKPSGVLILLYPANNDWSTVFIERTSFGPHGGQISLPGGKMEETDKDIQATALREAEEEIGIFSSEVEVIGQLTPLFVPHSNFSIVPVIGYLERQPEFVKNENEVISIIRIKLADFFKLENKGVKHINKGNYNIEAPYYSADGHMVWGATAMIMSELEVLLS